MYYDIGKPTNYNTNWWNTGQNVELSITPQGKSIINKQDSSYSLCYPYITDEFPSSWSARLAAVKCYNIPFIIEIDILDFTSDTSVGLYFNDDAANINQLLNYFSISKNSHVKLEVTGSKVNCYVNNNLTKEINYSSTITRFALKVNGQSHLTYKNLIIYQMSR